MDLCGTGWSLTRLLEIAGREDIDIFIMHYIQNKSILDNYRKMAEISREPSPLFVTTTGTNVVLEALNPARHEMVLDVMQKN